MNLPSKYQWLATIGTLPKMLTAAIQYLGIQEVPGKGSNPVIMTMAESIGLKGIYTDDDMSWCAVFMNFLCKITGKPVVDSGKDKYNLMRAAYLLNWGNKVDRKDLRLGDVVVINRTGGAHVFIFIGFNKTNGNFIGIGGNQRNSVRFDEFEKGRFAGARRFYATGLPASAKQYFVEGDKLSTNEA